MALVFETIVPVFSVVAVGYTLAGRRFRFHLPTLADLAILVTSPALMFSVLSETELEPRRWGDLAGGTLWVAAGTAVLALVYLRGRARARRGLLLPAVFWNAGNMGLACARLAFGPEGLEASAIVFVTMAVLSSTFGIWIAKGENGLREALRLPLVYASVGGIALALTETTLPRMVMEPIEMLGAMAIPLMLLNLGMQLRMLEVTDLAHSLVAVAIRMGGGIAFASLFVRLFDVAGVDRQVLLLSSVMPAAVINAVLAQRYGTEPGLVASAIVIGTLASLLSIPAVLLLVA
jgi:predicted permease